jgi:hypothetical protein
MHLQTLRYLFLLFFSLSPKAIIRVDADRGSGMPSEYHFEKIASLKENEKRLRKILKGTPPQPRIYTEVPVVVNKSCRQPIDKKLPPPSAVVSSLLSKRTLHRPAREEERPHTPSPSPERRSSPNQPQAGGIAQPVCRIAITTVELAVPTTGTGPRSNSGASKDGFTLSQGDNQPLDLTGTFVMPKSLSGSFADQGLSGEGDEVRSEKHATMRSVFVPKRVFVPTTLRGELVTNCFTAASDNRSMDSTSLSATYADAQKAVSEMQQEKTRLDQKAAQLAFESEFSFLHSAAPPETAAVVTQGHSTKGSGLSTSKSIAVAPFSKFLQLIESNRLLPDTPWIIDAPGHRDLEEIPAPVEAAALALEQRCVNTIASFRHQLIDWSRQKITPPCVHHPYLGPVHLAQRLLPLPTLELEGFSVGPGALKRLLLHGLQPCLDFLRQINLELASSSDLEGLVDSTVVYMNNETEQPSSVLKELSPFLTCLRGRQVLVPLRLCFRRCVFGDGLPEVLHRLADSGVVLERIEFLSCSQLDLETLPSALLKGIHSSFLTRLTVRCTFLGAGFLEEIVEFLSQSKSGLNSQPQPPQGLIGLTSATSSFRSNTGTLRSSVGDPSTGCRLEELDLGHCGMDSRAMHRLVTALRKAFSIRSISLDGGPLPQGVGGSFVAAIKENRSIREVSIRGCEGTTPHFLEVVRGILLERN